MTVRIATVQFTTEPGQAAENRARSLGQIEQAAQAGAQVIVLPELSVSGYTADALRLRAAAEPLHGETMAAWADAASRLGVVIVGGFCESLGESLFNAAIMVGPRGLLLHYRKLHLFDGEKHVFAPGDLTLRPVDTPFGRIGVCVCYDLRFVEVMRALALQDADLIAVPTAWVAGFDKAPRDGDGLIGQARGAIVQANLNQVYVACASQGGRTSDVHFLGSSLFADPYGRILAGPMPEADQGILIADMDLAVVQQAKQRSELIRPRLDRRTDIYGLSVAGQTF
ncbi:MAG TPA: nitrilase-related carbon-nitrogen hydrolase [Tardiphaga sp.]